MLVDLAQACADNDGAADRGHPTSRIPEPVSAAPTLGVTVRSDRMAELQVPLQISIDLPLDEYQESVSAVVMAELEAMRSSIVSYTTKEVEKSFKEIVHKELHQFIHDALRDRFERLGIGALEREVQERVSTLIGEQFDVDWVDDRMRSVLIRMIEARAAKASASISQSADRQAGRLSVLLEDLPLSPSTIRALTAAGMVYASDVVKNLEHITDVPGIGSVRAHQIRRALSSASRTASPSRRGLKKSNGKVQ